jgi:SAM-dependent methyltransferase
MPVLHVSYEPVRTIFEAMRSEQINGVPLSDVIGGGDPERVASETLAVLARYVDLHGQRSILDVGCGCGRIAAALTQHVGSASQYVGVDIVPGLVDFGRRLITSRYPNFQFLLLDDSNRTYDTLRPGNTQADLATLADARPAASVDLAIAVSLFTHLDFAPAVETFTAMGQLLTKGGRAFITIFLLDPKAREGIENGRTGFSFKHRTASGKLFAEKLEDPTYGVAHEIGQLEEMIRAAGFELEHWIHGYWSQGNSGESFQDALILRKI